MKSKMILSLLFSLALVSLLFAQVTVTQDTTFIEGGTLSNGNNAGLMESTINADTNNTGARNNPNMVYALYEGQIYFQTAPIVVDDPTGTLTIVGVPDPNNPSAKEKPIIVIVPTSGTDVVTPIGGSGSVNAVWGSVKFDNVYYMAQQTDGTTENELFFCGTKNKLPQELTINNCVFEFANIDLFDCTNELANNTGIGGWPNGAKFFITNSYFRNLFHADQWWGGRVFQCKEPVDTCWIENCTVTDGGLTFLAQNDLYDFVYVNHNTIVNNYKYWMLSPYRHHEYITNNIFINQNWVGEDTNVTNSGQDPDKLYMSTINIDTCNSPGNDNSVLVQEKYYVNGDSSNISSALSLDSERVYVSNNINYNDPLLATNYYKNSAFTTLNGYPQSDLTWNSTWVGPWEVHNQPGEWMNSRTKAIFEKYAPPHGYFVEENTDTTNPNTMTPGIADASVATLMGQWNQNLWNDPNYPTAPDITDSKFIFGDYKSTTVPGIDNGTKTDDISAGGSGIQVGITKFTDFQENFSQTTHISKIDGLPIGALMWNDSQMASYNSAQDLQDVMNSYNSAITGIKKLPTTGPNKFTLSQNYPNPFNPTTEINYSIAKSGFVTLKVYNVLGQEVANLVNQQQNAGSYRADFNATNLASGVYLYKLESGNYSLTKKMVLLK